jgi:hypothetical protein
MKEFGFHFIAVNIIRLVNEKKAKGDVTMLEARTDDSPYPRSDHDDGN